MPPVATFCNVGSVDAELYSYQHLAAVMHFQFGARGSVACEPLQEGLVGFCCRAFQIHLVGLVAVCLARERGTRQNSHFVCPADVYVC